MRTAPSHPIRAAALAGALALGAWSGQARAAETGLTGIWLLDQHTFDQQMTDVLPFTPEYKAQQAEVAKQMAEGKLVISDNGKKCLPIGMPGMIVNEFAMEYLETPGRVTVVSEASPVSRTISLTRKTHNADQDPTWNGDSIGHWEGKTLVVETVNMNDRTPHFPLGMGNIRSKTTKITERYTLSADGQTMVNTMTFEDPGVLTKPWTKAYTYHRGEPGAELWEYVCETEAAGWSERFKDDPEFKTQAAK